MQCWHLPSCTEPRVCFEQLRPVGSSKGRSRQHRILKYLGCLRNSALLLDIPSSAARSIILGYKKNQRCFIEAAHRTARSFRISSGVAVGLKFAKVRHGDFRPEGHQQVLGKLGSGASSAVERACGLLSALATIFSSHIWN